MKVELLREVLKQINKLHARFELQNQTQLKTASADTRIIVHK